MAAADSITKTKPFEEGDSLMENALVPVSLKLAQLIELSDNLKESEIHLPSVENKSIVTFVKDVHDATQTLESVAKHWIEACRNDSLKAQMSQACEQLQDASNGIYRTMNQLEHDASSGMCKQLINASKEVLQQTFQVLIIASSSELKELPMIVGRVKNRVAFLKLNSSNPELVSKYFKELSDELLLLNKICMRHHDNLAGQQQLQDLLANCLHTIRMTLPTLQEALTVCIAEPNNKSAEANRDFLIYQILNTITLISDTVLNKLPLDLTESNESGQFISLLGKAKAALTEENWTSLDQHFETWIYLLIKHAMFVAHLIVEERRSPLINICLKLLEAKNSLYEFQDSVSAETQDLYCNDSYNRLCNNYEDDCDKVVDLLYQLEDKVNQEILHLMVNVFAETSEPLERLVDPILFPETQSDCCQERLKSLQDYFYNHLDNMYEVARFIIAGSRRSKFVQQFEMTIKNLECLDPEISSLVSLHIQKISVNPFDSLSESMTTRLKSLIKEWKKLLAHLVFLLDTMVDPDIFITMSLKRLEDEMNVCVDAANKGDLQYLLRTSRSIRAKCSRVAQFLSDLKSCGNIFPNPLHVIHLIDQIHQSLKFHRVQHKLLKKALTPSNHNSIFKCKTFLDSTSSLVKQIWHCANFVCSALFNSSTEQTHPEPHSPIPTTEYSHCSVNPVEDLLISNCHCTTSKHSEEKTNSNNYFSSFINSPCIVTKQFYQNVDMNCSTPHNIINYPEKTAYHPKLCSSCPCIGNYKTESPFISPSHCVMDLNLKASHSTHDPFELDSFLDCLPLSLPKFHTENKHDTLV
ncbi:uncharacterized protein LOC106874078 [Octopus bimaculoides]|uniref:Uncharacterized protein n=1 Tax=Octopus bimaculoides TaxID=37653 RepID=A0A0L8GXI9_OCTBM|nr:uncharacterized protein LOC106874078 [Octopus bimaculoides]|eukprot:XP_014777158.1 PREDICTED: uncharacterized protein LOC106874078 [Octopus bimaculoides]